MAFKPISRPSVKYSTPEALFNDCKKRKYAGLLSHQADMLRAYQKDALDKPDVAFQMPTGSGKTLVGTLLCEWRRRTFKERPIYLAPTRQLAFQVANEAAQKYDIKAIPLVGSKKHFPAADKAAWQAGDALVITTFNGLFNVRPAFEDPDIILIDDAHAAENYFAKHWSVTVQKSDSAALWQAICALLKRHLDPLDHKRLVTNPYFPADSAWVDKLPTPVFFEIAEELAAIFDEHLQRDQNAAFAWSVVRNNLLANHLYISPTEVTLRPVIAPTFSHLPFANAKQRIFMSATLGQGGDLERLTGRNQIHRIPVPATWEHQGLGRRLFLFPARSLTEADEQALLPDLMKQAPRRAVLTPSDREADAMKDLAEEHLGAEVFYAHAIEQSKEPFVGSENGVAILANRYDGIDFAHDDCRLLLITGMPKAVNLQERFLMSRMGASILLGDRMMTRIVQAFGRCTRSATDYSAVVVLGESILNTLIRPDKRSLLHPELQAEIEFGLEQSLGAKQAEYIEYLRVFLAQEEEWTEQGESAIQGIRTNAKQTFIEGTESLEKAVNAEIDYQRLIWEGDYEGALNCARKVLIHLTGDKLRGYRCLWNYLAGSAAYLASKIYDRKFETLSKDFFFAAARESSGISWLKSIARYSSQPEKKDDAESSLRDDALIERLEAFIEKIGTSSDMKLVKFEKDVRDGIHNTKSGPFERSQVMLGQMLGYDAGNKETPGAPDPWWIVDENLCFIFEDHSEATTNSLDVTKARQVSSHPKWAIENLPLSKDAEVIPILVSPVTEADTDAIPHLNGVAFWPLQDFRDWTEQALAAFREARSTYPADTGDLVWRAEARAALGRAGVDLKSLLSKLKKSDAKKLLKPKLKK